MLKRRSVIRGIGGGIGAVAFMLGFGAWRTHSSQPVVSATLPTPIGQMGWSLNDHRGQPVRPDDWTGRPVMVFFGFTWCPNVCPTTLSDISGWLKELGPDADHLVVALVSVDPERDTPEVLVDYLSYFDPRIVGLTGSEKQIEQVATDFRITYRGFVKLFPLRLSSARTSPFRRPIPLHSQPTSRMHRFSRGGTIWRTGGGVLGGTDRLSGRERTGSVALASEI